MSIALVAAVVGAPLAAWHVTSTPAGWTALSSYWESRVVPTADVTDAYRTVECSNAGSCVAVGFGLDPEVASVTSTDGGITWTAPPAVNGPMDGFGPLSLACWDADNCFIAGESVFATNDAGRHWSAITVGHDLAPRTAACTGPGRCIVAGINLVSGRAVVWYTLDGDGTWSPGVSPAGIEYPRHLSCPSATECFMTAASGGQDPTGAVLESTDSGMTWTALNLPSGLPPPIRISCANAESCAAVVDQGGSTPSFDAITTVDGGRTWTLSVLSTGGAGNERHHSRSRRRADRPDLRQQRPVPSHQWTTSAVRPPRKRRYLHW
ncbi:MAG: WD40/YVTN/BNR-like repeat-containing protein [Acidimicrobiales bacterium]